MTTLCEDRDRRAYVLMTAAYNEEDHIGKTLASMISQSLPPNRWIIISDGSTDGTDQIIQNYALQHDFIRFLRVSRPPGHSFRSKVLALQAGSKLLEGIEFEYIGNLDADISVGPSYFEDLIHHFEGCHDLGISSGTVCEKSAGEFRPRPINRIHSVPHAAQLVRRECYEAIGGYTAMEYGGEDWYAQTCAKMKGWRVETVSDLPVFHHKPTGGGSNALRHRFRLGRADHSFGSDPAFELMKCVLRLPEKPLVIGSLTRLSGFVWSYLSGTSRPVSDEFMAFLRKEQRGRILSLFKLNLRALDTR
jgi:glycosyltransferase involved in cell wall biosynthesis